MDERELIREIRAELVKGCTCDFRGVKEQDKEVCDSCLLVVKIDNGLEKIGKQKSSIPNYIMTPDEIKQWLINCN